MPAENPPHLHRSGSGPTLYAKINYDVESETEAFARLASRDLDGCRRAFAQLLAKLDFSRLEPGSDQVVPLLLDVLQGVNRRIHRGRDGEWLYQKKRVELIEAFSRCADAEQARERFTPELNRLLDPLSAERGGSHPLVEQAKEYIEQCYSLRISLSRVAERLAVSPNYLSRLFRRDTGVTLTTYIQRVRLEHARLLLTKSERTISEIAYRVGYQTYRDFYRNFVKYEKASPRQVRRRLSRERSLRGPGPTP